MVDACITPEVATDRHPWRLVLSGGLREPLKRIKTVEHAPGAGPGHELSEHENRQATPDAAFDHIPGKCRFLERSNDGVKTHDLVDVAVVIERRVVLCEVAEGPSSRIRHGEPAVTQQCPQQLSHR